MVHTPFSKKVLLNLALLLIAAFQVKSQVTILIDSSRSGMPNGFIYKTNDSINNKKIFNSKCSATPSSDLKKVLVKEFENPSDQVATFTIYNDSGLVELKTICPNLSSAILRNDGAFLVYGSYFSLCITYSNGFYTYNSYGNLIRTISNLYGRSMYLKLFDQEKYLFLYADSLDSTNHSFLINKKLAIILDNNFNLVSKTVLDDDRTKHFLNFISIDEEKKVLNFNYLLSNQILESEFSINFTGETIKRK